MLTLYAGIFLELQSKAGYWQDVPQKFITTAREGELYKKDHPHKEQHRIPLASRNLYP